MDAYEFKNFIIPYLPISFEHESRGYFINYLLDALVCNWNNGKYQFSLLSANILFMTIIFRDFWFDDKYLNKQIVLNVQLPQSYYRSATDYFNLSHYNEKLFLESYLKSLSFDDNEIRDIKMLIDHRDHCAHAAGKIYYENIKVAEFFDEYKEAIIKIESTREESTLNHIIDLYKKRKQTLKEFIKDLVFIYSISYNECVKLIDYFTKEQDKDIKTCAYNLIFKHFLRVVSNNICGCDDLDDVFCDEVQDFVKSSDQASKQYALFESELSFEIQGIDLQTCRFDKIASLFENIDETNSLDNGDLESIFDAIKKNVSDQTIAEKIVSDIILFRERE